MCIYLKGVYLVWTGFVIDMRVRKRLKEGFMQVTNFMHIAGHLEKYKLTVVLPQDACSFYLLLIFKWSKVVYL